MPGNLLTLLLTLFALFAGSEPAATDDNGSGLDPNG